MKHFHNITIKIFTKPEGDYIGDEEIFLSLFPFKLDEEKIILNKEQVKGFEERKITIRTVKIDKDRHIRAFVEQLNEKLSDKQKAEITSQENRLDEHLHFFLRLDKEALAQGKYELTESGNCVHLNFSVAAFPKKREKAQEILKEIFK